jgi:hypothetical protein
MVEDSRQARSVRRRRALIGCVAAAASLALHAVLWSLLHAAPEPPRRERPVAAAGTMRWIHVTSLPAPARPAAAAAARAGAHSEAARARSTRAVRRARPLPVAVVAAPNAMPAEAAVLVDGSVFALPRVGYGDATRAQGVRSFAATATPAATALLDNNEGLRRQIVEHIGRQLDALPASLTEGRCTLDRSDEAQLLCDSDGLRATFGAQAAPLARLIAAYRRSVPGAELPVIELRAGRYRLSAP